MVNFPLNSPLFSVYFHPYEISLFQFVPCIPSLKRLTFCMNQLIFYKTISFSITINPIELAHLFIKVSAIDSNSNFTFYIF